MALIYINESDTNVSRLRLPNLNDYRAANDAERAYLVPRYLARLLHGNPDEVADFLLPLNVNGVYISSECLLIGLFTIEQIDGSSCPCSTLDEVYDRLSEHISETLSDHCLNCVYEIDGRLLVIVNYYNMKLEQVQNGEPIERSFQKSCAKVCGYARESLRVYVSVAVSTMFESVELLPEVFSILTEYAEYIRYFKTLENRILPEVQLINGRAMEINNCLDRLPDVISAIRGNDDAELSVCSEQLFLDIVGTPPFTKVHLALRIQAFVHELARNLAVHRLDAYMPAQEAELTLKLTSSYSGAELYESFTDLLEGILADYNKMTTSSALSTVQSAQKYISEHISNPALSPAMIADHVGVSRTALSSSFSGAVNEHLSSYIQRIRLARAVELMLSTELSIAGICEQSGYGSITTMHRAFHRYYHTSPAKYRSYLRTGQMLMDLGDGEPSPKK